MRTTARRAAIAGVTAGLAGLLASAIPLVLEIEESVGLRLLYRMRGETAPPANVIVAGISDQAAGNLGLREALRREVDLTGLPRSIYAELISTLDGLGASAIPIDILFREPRDADDDAALARSMREAGTVILFDGLERDIELPRTGGVPASLTILRDQRLSPAPIFAESARATGPFPLPYFPILTSQFWTFVPAIGDRPSLPVAAFAVHASEAHRLLLDELYALQPKPATSDAEISLSRQMSQTRRQLQDEPGTVVALRERIDSLEARGMPAGLVRETRTLLDLYAGGSSRYLNFYGRPRTVRTVGFDQILAGTYDDTIDWSGAIVFVGFSDPLQPKQDDNFRTFYSQSDGQDLSGAEIAATALANMIDDRILDSVTRGQQFLIALIAGLVFGACFYPRSVLLCGSLFALSVTAYMTLAHFEFGLASRWWPIVVPLLIQAPLALVLGLSLHYRGARAGQAAVTRGARRFLPSEIVDRITADPKGTGRSSELVDGICMVTDIERYTAYSEELSPQVLESELNKYYEALFAIVDRHGGRATDIVGDSMVAVWRLNRTTSDRRLAPVLAGLEIAERFSARPNSFSRTRVGLNAGEFVLGTVGAEDHLEYRAVGDVVNSAARVQNLNKRLGTTILGTHASLGGSGLPWRDLGSFRLSGKQRVLEIGEPLAADAPTERISALIRQFAEALELFRDGAWPKAAEAFRSLIDDHCGDGPSLLYLEQIESRLASPDPDRRNPVIDLSS